MAGHVLNPSEFRLPIDAPLSLGKMADKIVCVSGTCAFDAEGKLVGNDIRTQTRQTLENIMAVLRAAGADVQDVIRTVVYLPNMADFAGMNEIYKEYFKTDYPARTCIGCQLITKEMLVEIEVLAVKP